MDSGRNNPIFDKDGLCLIKGFENRNFELSQKTWEDHILKDKARWYFKGQFNKIVESLVQPDYILQSSQEKKVVLYVKKFSDLYILNTVTAIAYIYVVVNLNNNKIRTVYSNPGLKKLEQIWPKS